MRHQYLVADQNVLRSEELETQLSSNPMLCIVLPDASFIEMTKNEQWELTLRLSLAVLSKYLQRVFVSRAVSESLNYELDHKRPVNGHMLFPEATRFVREILMAVANGTDGEGIARIRSTPDSQLQRFKQDYFNHLKNKEQAMSFVDAAKSIATTEFTERARSRLLSREERLELMASRVPSVLTGVLSDYGFTREKAILFLRKKPLVLRYFYLKMWASIDWLEMDRLEGLGEKKVTNDFLDHEYIVTATFFNGVFSHEPRVKNAYQDMMHLISMRI